MFYNIVVLILVFFNKKVHTALQLYLTLTVQLQTHNKKKKNMYFQILFVINDLGQFQIVYRNVNSDS